ncbi:uncharacterized protein K460DRAFT_281012 [Cucurbitaria berberidis CBS 394.84]|uniref:M protein, serotype 2.1 n=1 Tax=Cucurbitaria berberidis CBS 394.84 TaxID=1168544 RepID=A0A9P4LAM8_9PLEO|nr:uncharacterized protein K460DRAFT_281012 [Cucurbitaria berberidis CBS 394.84]KAF1848541.1 hypothetical protein K460DRAFT_281012 [Cucurbitaria berberidis CBS 394.84]
MSTAAAANKAPSTGTPRREVTSRTASSSPGAANRTPVRPSTSTTNGPGGVARTRSVRSSVNGAPVSARAAAKRPTAPSTLSNGESQADATDDEARDEQAVFLQGLKDRLQKAETEAEERQKQVEVLNARLDEALQEQAKLEERAHEEEEKVESLDNEKRELTRQHRELEAIYEAERAQAMKEKEETHTREDELQDTIQRLKETMASKHGQTAEGDEEHLSRSSSFRHNPSRTNSSQNLDNVASFAPPSSIQRSNSRNNSKLIHQKDKIIEDLRLELAEYQVKVLEVENAGGGRLRELEKQLLETRMTNARLMEDNESFQLLLGEKTLNGDLSRGDFLRESSHTEDRAPSRNGPSTSLADELQSAEEADVEVVRKLEAEISNMKDQNKALTLYINKIIGRLLTYQGFESVLGNDLEADNAQGAPDKNKELPPPPPQENEQPQGFLQRAKSVAMGGNRKPRPSSMMGPPPIAPATNQQSVNEDPATAPSIPLTRSTSNRKPSGGYSHRRSTSEIPQPGAANVVNNMYRPSSVSTTPGAVSPGIVSPRNSFFGLPVSGAGNSNPTSRVPSGQVPIHEEREYDAKTETSSSTASHVDTPSPPRRLERGDTSTGVMTGKGMRPLRLVQNEEEAVKARKAANRASWFGGLFGQAPPQQNQENGQ